MKGFRRKRTTTFRGPDVLGRIHDHRFETPFAGMLMCSNPDCGTVANLDGSPASDDTIVALKIAVREALGLQDSP